MKKQMLRFALAGVAGFLVDSIVLYAAMATGLGFLRGRLLSFVCAVVVTWLLNRHYTFAELLVQQEQGSTAPARPPLGVEFIRYLIAMSLGGVLNLATYWLVVTSFPFHPVLPAIGVAAGALAGMAANFASARWWVFRKTNPSPRTAVRFPVITTAACLAMAQVIFWICHLHDADLPGLYFDAVNPDYLAARTLNPEFENPQYLLPAAVIPILGNLYHGVQNYYVGLPVFALLGFNMLAVRVAQGLFGSGILVMLHLSLQRATGSMWLAFAGSAGLATELAFLASFRTQMYIVIAGCFWLLWAIYLAFAPVLKNGGRSAVLVGPGLAESGRANAVMTPCFFSGVCTGLAVYSYFVFLFFVPAFVVMGWWHTRSWRAVWTWSLGFVLAMQTYVLGYLSATSALGGLGPMIEWLRFFTQDLAPMSAVESLGARLQYAWLMVWIAPENGSNELMIFGTQLISRWAEWKLILCVTALFVLLAINFIQRMGLQRQPKKDALLAYWHIAWLPVGFVAVSLIFGSRLWAHHYSPLVPLMYLILFLAVYHIKKSLPVAAPRWVWVGLSLSLVFGNLHQHGAFFERLEATGGTGKFSNALSRLAEDALSLPPGMIHVFPEWGFFTSFAVLTGNQRIYDIDASPANLQRLANEGRVLRLYTWEAAATGTYRDSLLAAGYQVRASGSYDQRDQVPAFFWMEAVVANSGN